MAIRSDRPTPPPRPDGPRARPTVDDAAKARSAGASDVDGSGEAARVRSATGVHAVDEVVSAGEAAGPSREGRIEHSELALATDRGTSPEGTLLRADSSAPTDLAGPPADVSALDPAARIAIASDEVSPAEAPDLPVAKAGVDEAAQAQAQAGQVRDASSSTTARVEVDAMVGVAGAIGDHGAPLDGLSPDAREAMADQGALFVDDDRVLEAKTDARREDIAHVEDKAAMVHEVDREPLVPREAANDITDMATTLESAGVPAVDVSDGVAELGVSEPDGADADSEGGDEEEVVEEEVEEG